MAFYSGAANSFEDLRTALIDACVAQGWTWSDSILSKGTAYVRPYVSTATTSTEGPGLIIQGGTGKSGSTLTGASDVRPRLGRAGVTNSADVVFPLSYSIHIFDAPSEVFLFVRYSVDRFGWLAFGISATPGLPGTGLWIAGIARRGYLTSTVSTGGFGITPTAGGSSNDNSTGSAVCSPGLFWCSSRAAGSDARQDAIHSNLDGGGWEGAGSGSSPGGLNAIFPSIPLIGYLPNAWNSESILLPIQAYLWRAASKASLVADLVNARYVRVDNYEPEQIINIGADSWKIYPFHRKNSAASNGGSLGLDHSGTFGIAIRYDGP